MSKKPSRRQRSFSANPSYHSGYFCHCSACRAFHNHFVKEIDVVGKVGAAVRAKSKRQLSGDAFVDSFKQLQLNATPQWIKIGDRVTAKGKYTGVVKFIGPLDDRVVSPTTYVGIQLDEPVGLHCGVINGKRYFETPKGRGLMVKYEEVTKRKPAERCPPVRGNPMFPSFEPGKYTRLWANSEVGSPVNPTQEWKEQDRAKSAQLQKTKADEESSQRANESWSRAKLKLNMMFILDMKGTQRNRPDQLPPKLLQQISSWKQEIGGDEKADQLARTLKKLHVAQARGQQELDDEKEKEEQERRKQERERRRLEAMGE